MFIEKAQKALCFWRLSMLLLTCCSAALLLLSQSGAAQKLQMSIPEARVCRPSVQQAHCTCVCSNIMETQQSKAKNSIRSFSLINGINWSNLRMALFALSLT